MSADAQAQRWHERASHERADWREPPLLLEYEYVPAQEDVRRHIRECEGRHTQQAIYSTFHDALTQVCYGCLKVRTTIRRPA